MKQGGIWNSCRVFEGGLMKASSNGSVQRAKLITDEIFLDPNDKDEEMKGGPDQSPRRAAFVGHACLFTVHLVKWIRLMERDR